MDQSLGDRPIVEEYRRTMNQIARVLDATLNGRITGEARKTGFVLLVFPFGETEEGRCNFISNGVDRKDIVRLFKEMITRFEEGGSSD